MSKRVKASGVPRVQDWDRARYSIVPPRSALDGRLTVIHTKILIYLGRANSDDGWCEMSQAIFAKDLGYNEGSVSRAVRELVQWEYLDKKGQKETGSVHCHYRVRIEKPNIANDGETTENTTFDVVRDTSPEGDRYDVVRDTGRTQDVKPVSPHKQTLLRSSDHKNSVGRAEALPSTTDLPSASKGKRGTRLPDDWTLPAEWHDWAAKARPGLDVTAEAEKFADHWRAQSGQRGVKLDWLATWRNWCRNARIAPGVKAKPATAAAVAKFEKLSAAMPMDEFEAFRAKLREKMGDAAYLSWMAESKMTRDGDVIRVVLPSKFRAEYVAKNHYDALDECAGEGQRVVIGASA